MDALGANIRIDSRGPAVLRVLPRTNDEINEEWIDDKTRYACDGLNRQRLDRPMVRRNGRLAPATWNEAFVVVAAKAERPLRPSGSAPLPVTLQDAESMKATMDLFRSLGSTNLDCRQDGAALGDGPARELAAQHHDRRTGNGRRHPVSIGDQSAPRGGGA